MKKVYSFTLALFLFAMAVCLTSVAQTAPTYINQESLDGSGNVMLLGRTSISGLSRSPYQSWFEKGKTAYKPDTSILNKIKPFAKDLSFKIYAATWCGDTRRELPRFVKILGDLGIRSRQYEMYMVDNKEGTYKQAPESTTYGESIFKVATFIVEKDGKEIGRIIERPVESLEKDLLNIVHERPYEPTYNLVPRLQNLIRQQGSFYVIENVEKIAAEVQNYKSSTSEMNTFAYALMSQDRDELAIAVLQINSILFPDVSGIYENLGDAYLKNENIKRAIKSFERSIELNPENTYSQRMLEKLQNQ